MDITPGHVMLQLLWDKTSELPKQNQGGDALRPKVALGPAIETLDLQGQKIVSR